MSEEAFLACYETVYRCVDKRYDVRGSILSDLVKLCLMNHGEISCTRREQFRNMVPEEAFNYIETVVQASLKECSTRGLA